MDVVIMTVLGPCTNGQFAWQLPNHALVVRTERIFQGRDSITGQDLNAYANL